MKVLRHFCAVALGLLLCLGVPAAVYLPAAGFADAVSGATVPVPEQPSGEFVVILNRQKHPDTAEQWSDFFLEKPVGVIMEDLHCLTAAGDAAGNELARRYLARLAEHQMTLRVENGLLVVSRAEKGRYDAIVLSREAAEAFDYSAVCARPEALVIEIGGVA